jgi:hypothetical protein
MVTKANGPKQADYKRLIRAAKWAKLPNLVFHAGEMTIVMPLDGTYVAGLPTGQPSAPDAKEEAEKVRRSFDVKDW